MDDAAFTQFWKDNRESFSPRSKRLTRVELGQKGIENSIIDQVTEAIDDEDSAYQAVISKNHGFDCSDYEVYRRRIAGYLKRRGFSYGVINHTIERIWQESGGKSR